MMGWIQLNFQWIGWKKEPLDGVQGMLQTNGVDSLPNEANDELVRKLSPVHRRMRWILEENWKKLSVLLVGRMSLTF